MTGRKKDTEKRKRIAALLRKELAPHVIKERLGVSKDLITMVKKEVEASK
jgi:hypothetical protein